MASTDMEEECILGYRLTGGCPFKDTPGWISGQINGVFSFL
jgi:hypothetical protein